MPESLPHPAHNRNPSAAVFVGRQREMAALRAALEHAQSGQGQLVMLVGEPGIGKTTIAKEFTEIRRLPRSASPVGTMLRKHRHALLLALDSSDSLLRS